MIRKVAHEPVTRTLGSWQGEPPEKERDMVGLKAKCPKDSTHNRFMTSVTLAQDWVVDEFGEWVNSLAEVSVVVAGPDATTLWTCLECGEEAEVSEVEI